ncbi:MAG: DegT/DnrJ/EryC1/StrS family aminotransferase [Candidatus Omnitrophota bacterium]|jgi:dTDP-4-amino-4,6-dideoxygalactose transaminase
MKVPFIDLHKQQAVVEKEINAAIKKVLRRGDYILGEEEKLFEREFGAYCGKRYAIGLNSGTDALFLSLVSLGIGLGDEVIVPVFTFIATAFAVSCAGAKPVFADIDAKTFNIDVAKIEQAITRKTKAIIPVHLFGQLADMQPIMKLARKYKLKVIEDACQSHGALYLKGKAAKSGAIGDFGCFSFYPTKNLGGVGDGGLVVTNDKTLNDKLRRLRDCGRKSKYAHVILGYNSRLDTLQAAVLRVKLRYLDKWNKMRRAAAVEYDRLLKDVPGVVLPYTARCSSHIYHIYAVRVKNRDKLVEHLKASGIGVMVNYPIPLHLQEVYKGLGYKKGDFPQAEQVSKEIISLPMHPYLAKREIKYVVEKIKEVVH